MLGWTVRELAQRAIVSVAIVNAIEDTNVPSSDHQGDLAPNESEGESERQLTCPAGRGELDGRRHP